MRLSGILILVGCGGAPTVERVPSERGPDMVRVPGATVLLGAKKTPPVAGFSWEEAMPGGPGGPTGGPSGTPGGAPNTGGQSNGGGPQGPPNMGGSGPPRDGPSQGGTHTPASGGGAAPGGPSGSHLPAPGGGSASQGGSSASTRAGASTWLRADPPASERRNPGPLWPFGVANAAPAPDLGLAPGAAPTFSKPAPDPLPPAEVVVSAFLIDVTEVTQGQYATFLEDTGYRPPFVEEEWAEDGWDWDGFTPPAATVDHPVVLVSWWDAGEYCKWAGKRLPTEAEWQLAALGPADDERGYPWGDEYDGSKLNHGRVQVPNFDDSDGFERTSPVGSFPEGASRYGLLDTFGNAWEWTADIRVPSWDAILGERRDGRVVDPHTGEQGLYAAVRGGAYFFDLRPNPGGERNAFLLELRRKSSGFRCARDP